MARIIGGTAHTSNGAKISSSPQTGVYLPLRNTVTLVGLTQDFPVCLPSRDLPQGNHTSRSRASDKTERSVYTTESESWNAAFWNRQSLYKIISCACWKRMSTPSAHWRLRCKDWSCEQRPRLLPTPPISRHKRSKSFREVKGMSGWENKHGGNQRILS